MNIKTVKANAWKFIEKAKENSFDLIFADPPYNLENLNQIPHIIFKKKFLKKWMAYYGTWKRCKLRRNY